MDYSENYSCMGQDEISVVYYDKHQITIHPMVVHYIDESGNQHHFSLVGVTKEKSHTIASTLAFLKEIQPKLKEKLPNLQTVHYITDSPSSQYSNKSAMFGTTSTWHWLEATSVEPGVEKCSLYGSPMKTSRSPLTSCSHGNRPSLLGLCQAIQSSVIREPFTSVKHPVMVLAANSNL